MKILNKAVIKSDLKRYWWVSAIYMLLMAFFILPFAVTYSTYSFSTSLNYRTDEGFLAFMFSIALTIMIFSYLQKGNAVSGLHSLPVKRSSLYLSHIFSAVVLIFVPIIISSIVIGCEVLHIKHITPMNAQITEEVTHYVIKYAYISGVYALLGMMISAFAMFLAGSVASGAIFTIAFMILPFFVIQMCDYIARGNVYGYGYYDHTSDILNHIYLCGIDDMWSKRSILYIVVIAVLFLINLLLYKIRKLENYDEVVAFSPLKNVFMYSVAVCFGYLGYLFFDSMFGDSSLFLGALPLGLIALIAAFMLNRKSFSIKSLALPVICYVALVGLINLGISYDITGYERRVPDVDDVESVEAYDNRFNSVFNDSSYLRNNYYNKFAYKGKITDKDGIADITSFHKYLTENKPKDFSYINYSNYSYNIKYNLKNGKTLSRAYYVPDVEDVEPYRAYFERDEYKKTAYPIINDDKKDITSVNIEGIGINGILNITGIDSEKLLEALKKDILSFTAEDELNISTGSADVTRLYIDYYDFIEADGKDEKFTCEWSIYLGQRTPNTLKLIKEEISKYPNYLYDAEDITGVTLDYSQTATEQEKKAVEITDRADIEEIYNFLAITKNAGEIGEEDSTQDKLSLSINIIYVGGENYANIDLTPDQIPNVLKKYMNFESEENQSEERNLSE